MLENNFSGVQRHLYNATKYQRSTTFTISWGKLRLLLGTYIGCPTVRRSRRIFNGASTLDLPFGEKEVSLACFCQVKGESQIFASDHKKIHNPKVR